MKEDPMPSGALPDIEGHDAVLEEIRSIASLAYKNYNYGPLEGAFGDVIRLFQGAYPGYRPSNVKYHDLDHTLAVALAVARLMHGAVEAGRPLAEKEFNIGVVSGLMHDAGYIQRGDDIEGTGAKYTLTHISRSIAFIEAYYQDDPLFRDDLTVFRDILRCTGLSIEIAEIRFGNDNIRLLGQILGTADLLAQMADRRYLEKLLDLYGEFVEAGITTFASKLDLLDKTKGFYLMILKRFSEELGDVHSFARLHFRRRANINENLYLTRIEKNMAYLDFLTTQRRDDYLGGLRRSASKSCP
jgi:hypothetical protein